MTLKREKKPFLTTKACFFWGGGGNPSIGIFYQKQGVTLWKNEILRT